MPTTINVNNLVQVGQLQTAMTRVKTELDALDGKNFGGVTVANGKINFFATSDTTGTPLVSVDLPEELFLDQVRTTFVPSFLFSAASYPNATDPNLDGKPVLVLAVKGDKATNPTLTYSFVNLERLIDTYTAANAGISIAGYSIGVQLSADAGNILSIADDGLLAEMKVGGASSGNFAIFGASGAITDAGFGVATNTDVNNMLDDIFGAGGTSGTGGGD